MARPLNAQGQCFGATLVMENAINGLIYVYIATHMYWTYTAYVFVSISRMKYPQLKCICSNNVWGAFENHKASVRFGVSVRWG